MIYGNGVPQEVRVRGQRSGHVCSFCGDVAKHSIMVSAFFDNQRSEDLMRFRTCGDCEGLRTIGELSEDDLMLRYNK